MQVEYYEDDDTYHGPFRSGSRLEADSINEALQKANGLLRNRKSELNEPENMTDGIIFTIHDESVELCFDHVLGILRPLCPYTDPPSELIVLSNRINAELIEYLKKHPDKMHDIRPRQFEELIAEILAHYGWEVQLTPPTKDGGYDIFAVSKDISGVRTSWIVECKKYKSERRVGVDTVRALYGASGALTCGNVAMMLATTSSFTTGAKRYAAGQYNFDLRDYRDIVEWINEYRPYPDGKLYIKDNMLVTF